MFAKIVDFFSLVVFSTTSVVNDSSSFVILDFNKFNYPSGVKTHEVGQLRNLDLAMFEKPIYFLWDLSTFLARWDLWITLNYDFGKFKIFIMNFESCNSNYSNSYETLVIDESVFKELSNEFHLAYQFSNKILSLGSKDSYSFTVNSLFDYYRQKNDLASVMLLNKFLLSFIEYNCRTGFDFQVDGGPAHVFLVPKWNNLSGINIRYFYFINSTHAQNVSQNLNVSLLSVDLKSRYLKDNMLIYPVVSSSVMLDILFKPAYSDYVSSKYVNLFIAGLTSSFSYNTIVISVPAPKSVGFSNYLRFLNFSMLDATSIVGWSSEGNDSGWGVFDVINSQSCVWYDIFCHITASVGWVMNNIVGFKQLSKLVNLFFMPMTLTLKTYDQYNKWLSTLPLVSPVIVSGAMLLVLFNFYRRFK